MPIAKGGPDVKKARVTARKAPTKTARSSASKKSKIVSANPELIEFLTKAWCRPSESHFKELHELKFRLLRALVEFQRKVGPEIGTPLLNSKAKQLIRSL
jgi:hypothetical protein